MIEITEADFSIEEVVERAKSEDVGAIVTFLGTVRNDGLKSMELEASAPLHKVSYRLRFQRTHFIKETSPYHYPSICLQEREHEGKDEDRLGSKGSSKTRPGTFWEISKRQRVHALYDRKLPGLSQEISGLWENHS
ncbi:MAG: molybdenum cofactor biosynthesis protein MoaE [Methanotrichaceae archaeon]|jgi:hypothetical protein